MVRSRCESRASVLIMHPNCTYTVRLGCEYKASVPKLHPNLIETSEGDEIVIRWQGDVKHLTILETRQTNRTEDQGRDR